MPALRCTLLQGLLILYSLYAGSIPVHADDWLPISSEELKMTSVAQAPAAPAVYLYRQVDRDDNAPGETNYERIKILTEEGRSYANVEIQYYLNTEMVRGIEARTIRPDGVIVKFDGTIFDKPISQQSGVKLMAKTFTLPDVQVGSIIEYRYHHSLRHGYVFDSHWILSQQLFTRSAKFSLEPYRGYSLRTSWPRGLPENTEPPKEKSGRIRLETRDVPAFVTEPYMPPENELKYRVDFIYEVDDTLHKDEKPEEFWSNYGKKQYHKIEKYLDQQRAMAAAVAKIVEPGDTQEIKLHKIYARVQQLRNLSYDRAISQQEADRENIKDAVDVKDVWNHGYGSGDELTWLFLALTRAAGLDAYPLLVTTRDTHLFNLAMMNSRDLNTNAVMVLLDGKELYLDPGSKFSPFGVLPWAETAVPCFRPEKTGGTWLTMPLPDSKDSRVERKAILHMTPSGTLEGKVTVTYVGQEALWRRLQERGEDEADRKQFLENQIKADVPTGMDAELTNIPEWENPASDLVAEYDVKFPGWAAAAGKRRLLPVGIFGAQYKQAFQHATRIHPIYFKFPYQQLDDVSIELPTGWQIASVPPGREKTWSAFAYERTSETVNGSLHLKRELALNLLLVPVKYYESLQSFFEFVRAGDEDQAILAPPAGAVKH